MKHSTRVLVLTLTGTALAAPRTSTDYSITAEIVDAVTLGN